MTEGDGGACQIIGIITFQILFVILIYCAIMSSSSVSMNSAESKKKRGVSPSATGAETVDGGADGGPSFKQKRMRLEDINDEKEASADPHADLSLALQNKAQVRADLEAARERHRQFEDAAERRLKECTTNEEAARQDIRARGEASVDSLLVVGNDSVRREAGTGEAMQQSRLC